MRANARTASDPIALIQSFSSSLVLIAALYLTFASLLTWTAFVA